jgi:2-polyprenyl-6-methoxyphenol hydroxylase-like FAD-dependent oxidoreductase
MAEVDLIVVGGGPAGVMTGLLFARAGRRVTVLEKHADFFRDFRGDTVHPSTMEILDDLGFLPEFLKRPHNRLDRAQVRIAGRDWEVGDLSHLHTPSPFIAMMPQWEFLDFLREAAGAYPGFELVMEAPVSRFLVEREKIVGVALADGSERRSRLVIAADGRSSLVRSQELLPVQDLGAPIDVLWFRLPKAAAQGGALQAVVDAGRMLVLIDRADYWQCAYVIPKGSADRVLAGGLDAFRKRLLALAPELDVAALQSLDDIYLLTVSLDRLRRWCRPGLLAIGDAAHAMSPVGGVGINLAIQDAVAAANILAGPLAGGRDVDNLLIKVQERRALPTRLVQAAQKRAHDSVLSPLLATDRPLQQAPLPIRLLDRWPLLRRVPGRLMGLGIRRERVRSAPAT